MQVNQDVQLDLVRVRAVEINTHQYDDAGRKIRAIIMEDGDAISIPSGAAFSYSVKKPDGTFVKGDCSMETESGTTYVTFALTLNMLAVAGRETIDITMTQNNQIISTMTFVNHIWPAAVQDDDVESTTEYRALEEALEEAANVETLAEQVAEDAEQAAADREAVEAAAPAQIALIEAAGQEVLDSIPADYTELSETAVRIDDDGHMYVYTED